VIGFIALVLVLQLVGEMVVRLAALPLPGPVVGMGLLFMALMVRGGAPAGLSRLANTLLGHLALLFVPAGVGVIAYLGMLAEAWLALGITLIASTLLGTVVTAFTLRWLQRRLPREPES